MSEQTPAQFGGPQSANATRRGLILLIALLCPVVVLTACLFFANLTLDRIDRTRISKVGLEAINEGTLPRRMPVLDMAKDSSAKYNPNDCLIMSMVLARKASSPAQRALSPAYPEPAIGADYCWSYSLLAEGRDLELEYYARYPHGNVTVAKALMSVVSFKAGSTILHIILISMMLALILNSGLRAIDGGPRDQAYLLLGLGQLFFTGLSTFGWSYSFAPSAIVIAAFLLFAYRWPITALSTPVLVLTLSLLGAFTATFEFFTGPTIETLILLFTILFIEDVSDKRTATLAVAAYCLSLILMLTIRIPLIAFTLPEGVNSNSASHLMGGIALNSWTANAETFNRLQSVGLSQELLQSNRFFAGAYGIAKMAYYSRYHLIASWPAVALLVFFIPAVVVTWSIREVARSSKSTTIWVLLGGAAFLCWHFLFVSHTIIHSNVMVLTLTWFAVACLGTLPVLLGPRYRAPIETSPALSGGSNVPTDPGV